MTQDETLLLNSLVRSPAWKMVEEIVLKHIQRLQSIVSLDLTKDPQELKNSVEARKLAVETLRDIFQELGAFGAQEKPTTNPVTRSMK